MGEVEVWVFVDEEGQYGIGAAKEFAASDYADNIGEITGPMRMVKVTLRVPLPSPMALRGTVPAEPTGGEMTLEVQP